MAFEAMFEPIQIGKLTIRNRVLSTAHAEVYATDGGMTTERYVQYYEEKAKGGIGLAICGGSSVVAIDSPQEWWSSVNLSTDRIIPHFQNLADAMHKHGAKIKMGQVDQIKQCVGANYCIDRQYQGLDVLCIQNAATSREYMGVPHLIQKSTGPKRSVVFVLSVR